MLLDVVNCFGYCKSEDHFSVVTRCSSKGTIFVGTVPEDLFNIGDETAHDVAVEVGRD